MRSKLAVVALLCSLNFSGVLVFAQNAPVSLPCDAKDFAKGVDAYRVVSPTVLYVNCGRTNLLRFDAQATLYAGTGGDRKLVEGVTASAHLFQSEDPWLVVTFAEAGGGQVLEKGKDYELDLPSDQQATINVSVGGKPTPMVVPFEKLTISFSTKPVATIKPSDVSTLGATFEVFSNLALQTFDVNGPQFAEIGLLKTKIAHKSETRPVGITVPLCAAGGTCASPAPAEGNAETFGRARVVLTEDRLHQPKATLEVSGLKDFFGDPLKIQNDVTMGAVPKTKDDSMWYLKADHQAGPGSKPGYAIEAKLAPDLGRPTVGGFIWRPAFNMDIGAGTVSNVKVNDTIVPSLGLTRLVRTGSCDLQAVRITPALSFETNKEFNKKNLLYDQDLQFFIGPLTSPRLVRSWQRFKDLQKTNPDLTFSSELADWGAGIQLFAGWELGGALQDESVKASKSSATVNVPTYTVARVRPKISSYVEYKRLNLTLSAATRYLLATEYTTRESSDGKKIRLVAVSGFHPYGEASVNFKIDQSGHVALSTTYS